MKRIALCVLGFIAASIGLLSISTTRPTPAIAQGPITPSSPFSRELAKLTDAAAWRTALGAGTPYTLPIASAGTIGGVRVGSGLSIDGSGILSASGGGGSPTISVVKPAAYGTAGPAATGAQNTIAIQAAIDAAWIAPSMTAVLLDVSGTWTVNSAGGTPARCLTLRSNTILLIAPTVTLRLANDQTVSNANPSLAVPVSIIYQPATSTNCYVGWPAGTAGSTSGCIDGNTSNQPRWVHPAALPPIAAGFNQTNGNHHILSQDGMDGLTVEGLRLINCFSNPINVGGSNNYGVNKNCTIRNVRAENYGEGVQVIACDNVSITDVEHIASLNLAGDGLELSHCRYFSIRGCTSRTSDGNARALGGAGIDLYACRFGQVDGCLVNGFLQPIAIETNFSDSTKPPDYITVSNSQFLNCDAWVVLSGGRVQFSNCRFHSNSGTGPQCRNDSTDVAIPADYSFTGCHFTGRAQTGASGNVTLRLKQCTIRDSSPSPSGILSSDGPVVWDVDGLVATSTATTPVLFVNSGNPTGRIVGLHAPNLQDGTHAAPILLSGVSDLSGLTIRSTAPLIYLAGSSWSRVVGADVAYMTVNATSGSLPKGTAKQRLRVDTQYTGLTFTPGARLKTRGDSVVTIPVGGAPNRNWLTLEYDTATDCWIEVERVVSTVGTLVVPLPGRWEAAPAGGETQLANPVNVGEASSLRQIVCYSGPNGTTGTVTIRVKVWGTELYSIVAADYGNRSAIFAPGQYPIPANSQITITATPAGGWAGNTVNVHGSLWQKE